MSIFQLLLHHLFCLINICYKKYVTFINKCTTTSLLRYVCLSQKKVKMVKKSYLQFKNHISEGTLFSSTFKVETNKVPSELSNFASK